MNEFSEYKDLFVQTSRENLQLLNDSLLTLEKNAADANAIADTFRAAHSLKGESAAMEYKQTAYLCHTIEDAFAEIKKGRAEVTPELADLLFRCFDAIGASIDSVEQRGVESDTLASITDEIKSLTGVKTEGIGKTLPDPQATDPTVQPALAAPERPKIKTVPVRVDQLDAMMDLVEELVIDRLVLKRIARKLDNRELLDYYEKAGRTSDSLQFQVMKIRAVPIKLVFDHFPRTVRDLARTVDKQIELIIEGQDLELDRTIVERLDEPLTHLIRNAADHGLGASGTIRLSAKREQDYAIVEVADNGSGINWEALAAKAGVTTTDPEELTKLLFSGLSTAEKVTEISGRGVGLGSVKKDVEDFGGWVAVISETGKGTTFRIGLPLTLSVIQALIVMVDGQHYGIPAAAVDRSVRIASSQCIKIAGQEVFVLDGIEIPLLWLRKRFGVEAASPASPPKQYLAVIVTVGQERVALIVDAVVGAHQIIVKPVPAVLKTNRAFSGATILGNGKSALLLNLQGLV